LNEADPGTKLQPDIVHMSGLAGSGMMETTTLQEGPVGAEEEALPPPKTGPSSVSLLPMVLQTAVML